MWRMSVLVVVVGLWVATALQAEPTNKPASPDAQQSSAAAPSLQGSALPTPLPASQFTGRVRQAYEAAAEIPEVLAGIACYCGCDKSQGHRHLLDCFVDNHGAT